MANLYYKLWADAIWYETSKHKMFRNWQAYTMVGISISQGLNLAFIFICIGSFVPIQVFMSMDIFPGSILITAAAGIFTLFVPFVILNYFLIFYKKKYLKLINQYSPKGGKLYIGYFIGSSALFILPLIIAKLLF